MRKNISIIINDELKLRLFNVIELLTQQWLGTFPNDYKQLSELVNIKKQKLSLQALIEQQSNGETEGDGSQSGGRGSLKGLRAKDDPNKRNPFSKRMTRK